MEAAHAFDYKYSTCAKDICAAMNDRLAYVYDPLTNQNTADTCSAAMGSSCGKYSCIIPPGKIERKDIKTHYMLG